MVSQVSYHNIRQSRISWLVESKVRADDSGELNFDHLEASIDLAGHR